ncbi:MAG: hypothetical protein IH819_05285 [Bacteroidetes bacterium]|nr:hypothetical protein [Bacteroidota bacterium]
MSFTKDVRIDAGKKTFFESDLVLIVVVDEEPEIVEVVEEKEDIEIEEEPVQEELGKGGVVNIGEKILLFYDFSEGKFIDKRQLDSDIFSKRYREHLVFTRFHPANIKVIEKSIGEVFKELKTILKKS